MGSGQINIPVPLPLLWGNCKACCTFSPRVPQWVEVHLFKAWWFENTFLIGLLLCFPLPAAYVSRHHLQNYYWHLIPYPRVCFFGILSKTTRGRTKHPQTRSLGMVFIDKHGTSHFTWLRLLFINTRQPCSCAPFCRLQNLGWDNK